MKLYKVIYRKELNRYEIYTLEEDGWRYYTATINLNDVKKIKDALQVDGKECYPIDKTTIIYYVA